MHSFFKHIIYNENLISIGKVNKKSDDKTDGYLAEDDMFDATDENLIDEID